MFKLIGFLVVVTGSFAMGVYVGQHKITDAKQAIVNLSRYALDRALGMGKEAGIEWQEALREAKSRILHAKLELLEQNFGNAKREVAKALLVLERARQTQQEPQHKKQTERIVKKTHHVHDEMTRKTVLPRAKLDEIQQDLDGLLND